MSILRDLFTTKVNSTMMSINERFTYLQKNVRPAEPNVMLIRAKNAAQQQASSKNRRLAMQMERRLTAMAALKIKKKSIRQRLGIPRGNLPRGNVRDRLSLPVGARGRAGLRGRARRNQIPGLRRGRSRSRQSFQGGNLRRTASLQSLNEAPGPRGRSRSRSRNRAGTPSPGPTGPRSRSRGRRSSSAVRQVGPGKRFPGGRFPLRHRGSFRGRRRSSSSTNRGQGNQINKIGQKNQSFGGNRGRNVRGRRQRQQRNAGTTRGQGRNRILRRGQRGRGRGNNVPGKNVPSKEELDKQLDQYMANTKSHLDKEIDIYMKETNEGDVF